MSVLRKKEQKKNVLEKNKRVLTTDSLAKECIEQAYRNKFTCGNLILPVHLSYSWGLLQ